MPVTDIISTPQAEKGFYPTPLDVAYKMLDGIDWLYIQSVLEPSAGKGDLIACMMRSRISDMKNAYNRFNLDVDCCELDPYLRQILKYNRGRAPRHRSTGVLRTPSTPTKKETLKNVSFFCRGTVTRTQDPLVPNQMR